MFLNNEKYNQYKRIKELKLNLNPRLNNNNQKVRKKLIFLLIMNNRTLLQLIFLILEMEFQKEL